MKKSKYNLGGLTALKDKIQGANPFPDLTKKERDAVMEAYTDGAIKEDGGLINDVPPMEVRNINLWLNDYSKYIPKESVEFSDLIPISLYDLNKKMSRVEYKEQELENLLKEEPKAKTEADIDGSRIMETKVFGGRGNWEGSVKDGFQVYNNEQQYIRESSIKDFARVLNNAKVWIEATDEYKDLQGFVNNYNIFLEHIKENPQSKEAEFLKKKEEPKKEEPKEEEPFVPRVERSGKWDESYSILCDELATYEMGGVIKTEIDEYGSNVPKALQEVFDQFDEDADAYVEAERLRMKANEIGYDFDYGLSGEPTDFWKISDSYKKGGYVSWKDKYNKKYGYAKGKSHSLKEISKDTKVSMKGLQKIYDKGVGARKTNPQSVRSVSDGKKRGGKSLKGKMSAEQWAMARVYSSVMGGKASKVDAKELKMAKGGDVKMDIMSDGSFNYGLLNEKYLKSLTNEKRLSLLTNLSEWGYIIPYKRFILMSNQEALHQVEQVITEQRDNQIPIYDYMYYDSDKFRDSVERDYELANPNYILYNHEVDKWFERENPQQFLDEGYLNDWQFTNDIRQDYIQIAESPRVDYYVIPYILDENNPKDDGFIDYIAIHKPSQRWGYFDTDDDFNPLQIEKENGVLSFTNFDINYAKGGSIKRNANSPLLKYVNFEDGWSINLKKLNLYTNQNGKKYKSKNKYGISRQGGKDKDIWEFETLNEAKIKFDELVELGKTYSKIRNQGDVNENYAKGGSTSKKSCYTKELKYKDGGMIFTFEEGGEISDTCYVNYEGYQIQSTRCKREGITYFMIGEYPEVAKALYKNYTSEWIYYNRLARLFVSPETAKQFIQEASKYFNPIVPIEPYFLDVDRSFATYSVRDTRPFEDVPISVSVGKSTTARKLGDKIQERKREEKRLKRIETLKKQGKPFFKEDDYRKADGKYWAISTIISLGGEGDWGDDKWKNAITRENIPYDNGISLMTLIHEYAHCLDFNQSIAKGRIYERPIYELELLSGRNSLGQKFSSQEMMSMREAQKSGRKRTTLLSNHKEYFIQALSDILRGGMSNGIPILNEIENEAHEIEKRVGGKAYADEQRKKVQEDFLLKMQKTIEKANKPSLSVKLPIKLKEYLSRTSANYILQLPQKEIDKKVGTELLPHISNFKDVVRENMAFNPTENAKLLKDLRKIEKDIKRLQERT